MSLLKAISKKAGHDIMAKLKMLLVRLASKLVDELLPVINVLNHRLFISGGSWGNSLKQAGEHLRGIEYAF